MFSSRWGDVTLKVSSSGLEYLELDERQTKTRTGENLADIRKVSQKMFSCKGSRNPIDVYKLYMSKRPLDCCRPLDPFYLAPRTVPVNDVQNCILFKKQRVGEKKQRSMLKTMAKVAGLNPHKKLDKPLCQKTFSVAAKRCQCSAH